MMKVIIMMKVIMMVMIFPFFPPWCKAWWSPGNLTADWAKYKGGQRVDHTTIMIIVITIVNCHQDHHGLPAYSHHDKFVSNDGNVPVMIKVGKSDHT